MSTVRYFDSIPHIVRYGMHDDKTGKSWTLFYRNGVRFKVHVSSEDVSGTSFSETWLELIKPVDVHDRTKSWVRRWESLCDCVITPCLPLLATLAPSSHQWVTLHDYLHTPSYELKLVADDQTAEVVPEITSGPVDRPSYEHSLFKFSEISLLPTNVPQYQAEELLVLGQEKNWRRPPHNVRAPNGDVFYFRPCNNAARHVNTGRITNNSLDIINAYSRLHSESTEVLPAGSAEAVNIPKLRGIVISHANAEPGESSLPSASGDGQARQADDQPRCAGIVLTYVSGAKSLADVTKLFNHPEQTTDLSEYKEKWKEQIAAGIRHLHAHRITVGGRSDPRPWYLINQHTVYIANIGGADKSDSVPGMELKDADAWLMLEGGCTVHPSPEQEAFDDLKFEEEKAMDWTALEKVFQF
ncbi:uncharacterized protein PV07_02665 [Cladophialophora immunda]|uniref:Uncharacterized protein n=1 Tax=Cladophialophora immunda TaxID=569365 RepID=A0A0D2CLS5_9EURO|nr:uncharacterized protein PV07_02665 [Cladophialophora immunda]KIW30980.1 hypothetical protein PV07_02665 [Cladophialophora immunda]OQV05649.1 hypothetical protein CLAIMM_10349 [Cladophialophora immunda]